MKKKIYAMIPARKGSVRLKMKNLALQAALNFSNTALFLKLGLNPRIKISEIAFQRF